MMMITALITVSKRKVAGMKEYKIKSMISPALLPAIINAAIMIDTDNAIILQQPNFTSIKLPLTP